MGRAARARAGPWAGTVRRATLQVALLVVLALAAASGVSTARADYPEQPIRVLMPFPPGGAVDLVVRLVTDRMATSDAGGFSRGFVIENHSGAGGVIATDAVITAAGA